MKKVKIIALLSAIAVAVLLFNFLNSISKPTIIEIEKVGVITANQDIPPNTTITEDMIVVSQVPVEGVHVQSLKDKSEAIGKVSSSEIVAGELLLSSKLITPGEGVENGTLAYAIEPGMRAITIEVSNTTGLSNMIMPNNMVDVIGQYAIEELQPNGEMKTIDYTTMLLENVKVLAVDDNLTAQEKESSENAYVSLTLQVTPVEAMHISMTEFRGELRAILRSPLDEGITSLPALTIDKVIFKNK